MSDDSPCIVALLFPKIDQIDLTGPFEVLSRVPRSTFHLTWKERTTVRDINGLRLTADATFDDVPQADVLLVPGGFGQQDLMEDEMVLSFIRQQAGQARYTFSVCTGALICGAAGLLRGVRSTTHWSTFDLLRYFGAIPVNQRVVVDDRHVSASGVTAGIDGALTLAGMLCGEAAAQQIQLAIEYAPEPPFHSGTPETAPAGVLQAARQAVQRISDERRATAIRAAERLGIDISGI